MKKYRKVPEFERMSRKICAIKNDFSIVERQMETAKDYERISYAEYQMLSDNLKEKAEELRIYDKTLGKKEES